MKKIIVPLLILMLVGCTSTSTISVTTESTTDTPTTVTDIPTTVTDIPTTVTDIPTSTIHEHNYVLSYGSDHHFKVCECGDVMEAESHSYTITVLEKPTETYYGLIHKKCDVCGYEKEEEIDIDRYIDQLVFELSIDESYYIVSGISDYSYDIVVIPSTYNDKPVKEIKERGFADNRIKYVYISDGVTSIKKEAFHQCFLLNYVYLPKSLKTVGEYAFNVNKIKGVYISSLESWCNIEFANEYSNPLYSTSEYNLNSTFYLNNELVTADLVIPDSVTSIGEFAFIGLSFNSVTIPSTLDYLGNNFFYYMRNYAIERLYEYKNGYYFGNEENPYLVLYKIDKDVDYDGVFEIKDGCKFIFSNVFSYFSQKTKTEIEIPSSVKSIGSYAFSYSDAFNSITLSDNILKIGHHAFYNANIESIELNGGIKKIDDSAFIVETENFYYNGTLEELLEAGPFKLLEAGSFEFYYDRFGWPFYITESFFRKINNLYILDSLGTYTYKNNNYKLLTRITVPTDARVASKAYGDAIRNCMSVVRVVVEEGVQSIDAYAFQFCYNLEYAIIPKTTIVDENAFFNCTYLK